MCDYDELVKRLKESDDNCHAECYECPGECLSSGCNIFSEAADAIEELLAERDRALKRLCEWCGVCSEESRKALECDDIAMLDAVPKWISVEERLPGKDDMVFFYYEWAGQSGTVYKEVSLSTLGEIQHFGFKMIAWMPLPAPPKEENKR